MHLAGYLMVKNEKKRIHVTLESVRDVVDSLVVFDTGSTDNTLEIIKTFCDKYHVTLRLLEGTFVDFSTSRNEGLKFVDTFPDIDYVLLLDCNEELRNPKGLRNGQVSVGSVGLRSWLLQDMNNKTENKKKGITVPPVHAWFIRQEWFSGVYTTYYNFKLIQPRHNFFYSGVVHEFLDVHKIYPQHPRVKLPEDIFLYQDRTQDDDKSSKRFHRDAMLLQKEVDLDPTNTRNLYYLAQSYNCINDYPKAFKYYEMRSKYTFYEEEQFHAFLNMGNIAHKMLPMISWDIILGHYLNAYRVLPRVEPLLKISDYYIKEKMFELALVFLVRAVQLPYPSNATLFVDSLSYDYLRWHYTGIVAWYCPGNNELGLKCCQAAIQYKKGKKEDATGDENNLKFYMGKVGNKN